MKSVANRNLQGVPLDSDGRGFIQSELTKVRSYLLRRHR
ncbi:Uncharacterised protein [Escherichia coli]|uniref:Uncharacterized protein n=1 Tax=Escherichia coli TaxID=562 RepID=A0A377DCA1_ECOLX|nr:Uncharacterised protein [Escherichia coli]